jgi:predicted DNA-binding transcriptional regulator AlpA
MTVADLSTMLQVRPSTIYFWSSIGFVPVVKLGRALRFDRTAIRDWIGLKSKPGRARRRLEIEIENPRKRRSRQVEKSAGRQHPMKKTGESEPRKTRAPSPEANHE